mmetsp:Transcript_30518/g.34688  ORF Transcript_30518/g.34688 Transcript_30518/m.34688 type:complete len:181 (+) Transcript_30518:160-702(+)
MSDTVTLVSKEGEKIEVSSKITAMSGLIKNIIEDQDSKEDIVFDAISTVTLNRIVNYCQHHEFINPEPLKKPLPSNKLEDFLGDWDREFLEALKEEELTDLINAANFLDVKALIDICCARVAAMFKGKSIDELRAEYNIEEEFTPEVEEQLKKEYPWALEDNEDRIEALRATQGGDVQKL